MYALYDGRQTQKNKKKRKQNLIRKRYIYDRLHKWQRLLSLSLYLWEFLRVLDFLEPLPLRRLLFTVFIQWGEMQDANNSSDCKINFSFQPIVIASLVVCLLLLLGTRSQNLTTKDVKANLGNLQVAKSNILEWALLWFNDVIPTLQKSYVMSLCTRQSWW